MQKCLVWLTHPFPPCLCVCQLELRIDRHQDVAKQLLQEGRRDRALLALKKKKMTENQLGMLMTHVFNVESMVRVQ